MNYFKRAKREGKVSGDYALGSFVMPVSDRVAPLEEWHRVGAQGKAWEVPQGTIAGATP